MGGKSKVFAGKELFDDFIIGDQKKRVIRTENLTHSSFPCIRDKQIILYILPLPFQ